MQTPQPTPHTFSPQQEAILTILSRGANRTSACHAADLPRRTFYNWIKADPVFSEAVEEAEAESIGVAEDLAYECAMKAIDDPRYLRALFFWLKHRAGWIQARPDRPPSTHSVAARHAVPSSSPAPRPASPPAPASPAHLGATGPVALPSEPVTLPDPASPSGDGTPAENPVIGVPFVPSEPSAASAQQSAPNLPASNNPKSAIQNPKSVVPSVPSKQQAIRAQPSATDSSQPPTPPTTHTESARLSPVSSREQDRRRFQQFRQRKRN